VRLREQYATIQALNTAWVTRHASWEALLASVTPPDRKLAPVRRDLEAFSEAVLEAYFRGCREAVKAAAPDHLYLGCRFAGSALGNEVVMRIASRHCDVVSINVYRRDAAALALPRGLDRPMMIGEFHFTAMDSVMQPAGLMLVANQVDRGRAYATYVRTALRNPAVVGAHWFQFYDQPTTGRFDGENYQTGLLDIADSPYLVTIGACRALGATMYALRSEAVKKRERAAPNLP
jgi:hypothetical protein